MTLNADFRGQWRVTHEAAFNAVHLLLFVLRLVG